MNKFQISNLKFQIHLCFLLLTVCLPLAIGVAHSQGLVVMAKKVSGELPLDPAEGLWKGPAPLEIPLAPQVMAKPRTYESPIKNLRVKAIHNTREIAFLVEWDDQTRDDYLDLDKFSDAVALEFPSASAAAKPHFAMGDKENTVDIWVWKANWQKVSDSEKMYASVDDFLGGVLANNPVSKPRKSPVENIIAQGFGSATDMEKSEDRDVAGNGIWETRKWSVVFKRTLASQGKFDVSFREGGVTPVAFAVWNGSDRDRGGRKVVSTWYYVGLETEEKKTTYIYPLIALIVSAGILAAIILGIRRKRGVRWNA
jgi:hypothetical protein